MPNSLPAPAPVQMPHGGKNPYDFILNSKTKKKPLLSGSFRGRILLIIIGGSLLIIVALLVFSFFGGADQQTVDTLTELAQQETEIARVAAIGVDKAQSAATKNFATTSELSMESSQSDTVARLAKIGHKLNNSKLSLLQNSKTDDALDSAEQANNFDDTFTKLIKSELVTYRLALQNVFGTTQGNTRLLIQNDFNTANLLIGD